MMNTRLKGLFFATSSSKTTITFCMSPVLALYQNTSNNVKCVHVFHKTLETGILRIAKALILNK